MEQPMEQTMEYTALWSKVLNKVWSKLQLKIIHVTHPGLGSDIWLQLGPQTLFIQFIQPLMRVFATITW